MGLLIATKQFETKVKTCQMHGEPYEVHHPHTVVKYKLNNEKVKTLEMNRIAKDQQDVLWELIHRSKRLLMGTFTFVEWDTF